MKKGIKYGFLLTLMMPLSGVYAVEKASDELALQSLDAITSKVDDAPALLLLTPSQLEAISPPEKTAGKPQKNQLAKPKEKTPAVPLRELKAQQAKINQLNATLAKQNTELKQLRQIAKADADARTEIEQLKKSLQDNLQNTEKMQQQLVAMTTAQSTKKQEDNKLRQALEKSQQQSSALQKQIDTLTISQNERATKNQELQQELAALKKQQAEKQQAATVVPKSAAEIRDYAIGSSLGKDMLALLQEKAAQGIEVNDRMAFAGVQDTLNGKPQLPQDKIAKALFETEVALKEKEKQLKTETESKGAQYIAQFKKQKRAKQDPSGFYYRVDYLGDGKISPTDTVAVVVKESLIDGKVIKDMDVAGTSISQPLNSYPPMFKAAISQLQNHGSMTMVVPPELAYGDKGLPPDIPPGSTMVYNVRVLEVLPTSEKAPATK